MRIEYWINKATNTNSKNVTITLFQSNNGCTNGPQSYVHCLPCCKRHGKCLLRGRNWALNTTDIGFVVKVSLQITESAVLAF